MGGLRPWRRLDSHLEERLEEAEELQGNWVLSGGLLLAGEQLAVFCRVDALTANAIGNQTAFTTLDAGSKILRNAMSAVTENKAI